MASRLQLAFSSGRTLCRTRAYGTVPAIAQLGLLLAAGPAAAQNDADAFDGSFRLETGEVITGGLFVEGGEGRFLYMDTEHLAKGGLFDRGSDTTMRSVIPPGAVEIEFVRDQDGGVDGLVWRETGRPPVRGVRVWPHDSRPVHFHSRDGTELRGRLLTPRCPGPHPTVVVVHGSGPVDRHGGPYQMFFLTQGVAVLAYDKRGFTTDPEPWREPALEKLSEDARGGTTLRRYAPRSGRPSARLLREQSSGLGGAACREPRVRGGVLDPPRGRRHAQLGDGAARAAAGVPR